MFRKDRMGRRRGGVLLYINETIPAYEVQLPEEADCNDVIWCKLVGGEGGMGEGGREGGRGEGGREGRGGRGGEGRGEERRGGKGRGGEGRGGEGRGGMTVIHNIVIAEPIQ